MSDLYSEKKVRTAKEHKCDLCCRKIPAGFTAVYKKGKYQGIFFSIYHCNTCAELARDFSDYVTHFWEGTYDSETLADSMEEFDCTTPLQLLNKLKEKYNK